MAEAGEKIGDLYVEIGARTTELNKGVAKAQKDLVAAGERMAKIGQALTIGLSIPAASFFGQGIAEALKLEAGEAALKKLFNATENLQREFGEMFEEIFGVSNIVEILAVNAQRLADALDGMSPFQKKLLVGFVALVGAIGPVVWIAGKLMAGIGLLKAGIVTLSGALALSLPMFAAIVAAIAGVVTLFTVARGEGDTFTERFSSGMAKNRESATKFWASVRDTFGKIMKWTEFVFRAMIMISKAGMDAVAFTVIAFAMNAIEKLKWFRENSEAIFTHFGTVAIVKIGNALTHIDVRFQNLWHNVKEGAKMAWDWITNIFTGGGDYEAQFKGLTEGLEDKLQVELPELEVTPSPTMIDIGKRLKEKGIDLGEDLGALYAEIFGPKNQNVDEFVDGENKKQDAIKATHSAMQGFFSFEQATKKVQAVIADQFQHEQRIAAQAAKDAEGKVETEDVTMAKKTDKLINAVENLKGDMGGGMAGGPLFA